MSMQANTSNTAAQEYEGYEETGEYESGEYDSGEYYDSDAGGETYEEGGYQNYPPPPPPPRPAPKKGTKGKKKPVKKLKKKPTKEKKGKPVKKGKKPVKKGKRPVKGKRPAPRPAGKPMPPPPPPPSGYQQEYYDEGYGQTYEQGYTQEEYFPVQDDTAVVIEDQSMIETVVEEEVPMKKGYQRKTDDPIYSIEEKIDRMLMGKELSFMERYQRKFGEDLVLDEPGSMTSYTKRDLKSLSAKGSDEESEETSTTKGPVAKKKDDKKTKKEDKKAKKEKKKAEKGEKKSGRFGMKFGGGKDKAKKMSPAEMFKSKTADAKPKSSRKSVAAFMKKSAPKVEPEPEPEPVEEEEYEMDLDDYLSFKAIVDDLLDNLPEDIKNAFLASDDFKIYEKVGVAQDFTDDDSTYINIVNELLGDLPDEVIEEFTNSDNFELYQTVVEWGSE